MCVPRHVGWIPDVKGQSLRRPMIQSTDPQLSLNLELTNSFGFHPPGARVTVPPPSAFLWVLWAEVSSSCLCGKHWAISPAFPASFDPGRTMALTCLELGHPCNQLWTKNILYLTLYCMLGLDLLLFLLNSRSSDRPVLRSKAPVFMPALQVKNLACLSLPGCRGLSKVKGPQGQHPQRGMASPSLETWLTASNCLWKYFLKNAWLR